MRTRIVMYVDERPAVRSLLAHRLGFEFAVDAFGDARHVEAAVRATSYDGLIADLEMPEVDGIEMIRRVEAIDARLARRAVLLTGTASTSEHLHDLETRGHLVLHKSWPLQEVVHAVLLRIQQHP
jgi:DNA-binding response OmpR family regulator